MQRKTTNNSGSVNKAIRRLDLQRII